MECWTKSSLQEPNMAHIPEQEAIDCNDRPVWERTSPDGKHSTQVKPQGITTDIQFRHAESNHHEDSSDQKWRAVLAITAGVFQQSLCWGIIMTFGAILTFYTSYLLPDTSKTALALLGALPPFLVLGMSVVWGRLLDAGYHRKINIFSAICLTIGLAGLAFTGERGRHRGGQYWQILLATIPIGIGQSAYFLTAPHVAKSWLPSHRKGLAMGITNSGSAIGGIIWPLVFTRLTARYSFRAGIGALAGISGLLGIFICCASVPGSLFEKRPIVKASNFHAWLPTCGLRSRTFLAHLAAMCCVYSGILTISFFIEYWAQVNDIGVSEAIKDEIGETGNNAQLTVYLVVIMNACQLPGRLLGSILCDKVSARKFHAITCLLAVVVVGPAWFFASNFAEGCVFAAMFGLVLGVMVSLPINDTVDLLGPDRASLFGQYAGVVYTTASPFVLTGAVISGAIVDHADNGVTYTGVWAICCFGACAVLIFISFVVPNDTWKFDNDASRGSVVSSNGTLVAESTYRDKRPSCASTVTTCM